jgi:uncharacterized protein YtpQ (UPF0354 family)
VNPEMNPNKFPQYQLYQHTGNAFTFDYPEGWHVEVDDDKFGVLIFPGDGTNLSIRFETFEFLIDLQLLGDNSLQFFSKILEEGQAQEITESKLLQYPSVCGLTGQMSKSWVTGHDDLTIGITVTCDPTIEHEYQPVIERVLTSFRIHRQAHVEHQRLLIRIVTKLRDACPDSDFKVNGDRIANDSMELGVDNLIAQIKRNPSDAEQAIDDFVASVAEVFQTSETVGEELWDHVQDRIFPMIRPDSMIQAMMKRLNEQATEMTPEERSQHILVASPWLADLVVCYAIDLPRSFRMINQSDLTRWGVDEDRLHEQATKNLKASPIPDLAAIENDEGQVIFGGLAEGGLSAKSSYLLHPDLFVSIRDKLGNDVYAAVPNRDSLMLFSMKFMDRSSLVHAVSHDYQSSDHQISDRIFQITRDGVVLA